MNARQDVLRLSAADERWIASKIAAGEYASRSAAIAGAVARVRRADQQNGSAIDAVEELLLQGCVRRPPR